MSFFYPVSEKRQKSLGQILLGHGTVRPTDLARATRISESVDAPLSDVLRGHGWATPAAIAQAQAAYYGVTCADFTDHPPLRNLIDHYTPNACLRDQLVPWRVMGHHVVIATARPDRFEVLRPDLERAFGPVRMAVCSEDALAQSLALSHRPKLVDHSEARVPAAYSCRRLNRTRWALIILLTLCSLATLRWPLGSLLVATLWASAMLGFVALMRFMALIAKWRETKAEENRFRSLRPKATRPIVSIIVPLYKERAIASRLVKRLERLTYPRAFLDICLAVEEDDIITQQALTQARLPPWMRQIIVPRGHVRTKPRALNYTLDFCRGEIVGIYDAEDAPAPDQLERVVDRFQARPKQTACLQGILDYYNTSTNWIARCFTIEYATWFRIILAGYGKLGLMLPLGGTTLFVRRDVLEEIGGWDAHNVTEDADLGIRLARFGYRTELIATVTEEEANCHVWPWIKQRSRWLKGFALTYAVHMRRPVKLLREVGLWRFIGLQALLLAPLSQMLLAPVLWLFWALPFGLPHPLEPILGWQALWALGGLFLAAELIYICAALLALTRAKKRHLWVWLPMLHLYFPMATFAGLKAFKEILTAPYYWDKTAHGLHDIFHHTQKPAPRLLQPSERIDGPKIKEWAFAEPAAAYDHRPTGPRITFGLDRGWSAKRKPAVRL